MSSSLLVAVFGGVLVVSVLLSWVFAPRRPTIHAFFWGDQKVPSLLTTSLLLSGSFSLNGLLYQTWLGFTTGWWSLLIQLVWCSGFIFLASSTPRFQQLLREGTMHGVIGQGFGVAASRWAAVASIVGFSILIGWEASVGADVLQTISATNASIYLALAVAMIAGFYTSIGGLRGNAYANLVQNIAKTVILVWCVISLINISPSTDNALWGAPSAGISWETAYGSLGRYALIANLAFSFFWQAVDMSNWQDISATSPTGVGRRWTVLISAIIVFFLPGVIGTIIGVVLSSYVAKIGVITDQNILNRFLEALSGSSPVLSVALVAAYAAAMLSTIDGAALSAAQAATWDITNSSRVKKLLKLGADRVPNKADDKILAISRLLILGLSAIGACSIMALVVQFSVSLFSIVYLVVIAQMSLVGPVLYMLFGRRRDEVARLGYLPIALALAFGFGAAFVGQLSTWSDSYWLSPKDLYSFAPVIAIMISGIVAYILPREHSTESLPTGGGK